VQAFNQTKSVEKYIRQPWAPLLLNAAYERGAGVDSSLYEGQIAAGSGTRMPYDLPKLFKGNYDLVAVSGFGNAATTDFALATIKAEQLGQRGETDMLCLSYSSPDILGHIYGPDSWETMDMYLRLDQQFERLLGELDQQLGLENVLIFLTADHGVAQVPDLAVSQKLPAGRFSLKEAAAVANARLAERYGPDTFVVFSIWEQLYLNRALLKQRKISVDEAASIAAEAVKTLPWVQNAWGGWALRAAAVTDPFARRLALGCHPDRSGDVFIQAKSGYLNGSRPRGTGHSTGWAYDTHVPMLFFGWGIQPGETVEETAITDIAPTVAAMLKIQMPSACIGKAKDVKRKK
jgi:predicted AlkP superfamily pyrophosphatase or phosphodiesterase